MKPVFTKAAPEDWVPPSLEWDGDSYPTNKTLKAIRNWPYDKAEELFIKIQKHWFVGEDYCHNDDSAPGCWRISSAGWSGNESCLAEMERNHMLWMQIFVCHRNGGHYVFSSTFPRTQFRVRMEVDAEVVK